MGSDLKVLCVIPARGGSKSIPNKNLRILGGRKLVEWPINAALNCKSVTTIVCSSDSDEILEFVSTLGVETRKRPLELATDEAASPPVVLDVINSLESQGRNFDYVFMLEPTSPLTNSEDLQEALNLLESKSDIFDSLVTVAESVSGHPDFTFSIDNNLTLKSINQNKWVVKRRQDLSKLYFIEGSLYLSKISTFKSYVAFVQERTIGYQVSREKSFEIDEELDFYIFEALLKYQRERIR